MSETSSESIWNVTDEPTEIVSPETGIKGNNVPRIGSWRDETGLETEGKKGVAGAVKVSTQKLEQEMTRFLQVVGRLFNRAEQQVKVESNSGMRLAEIELSVEISGEGQVKLIGSGAKASGKGAIKLIFKRQDLEENG